MSYLMRLVLSAFVPYLLLLPFAVWGAAAWSMWLVIPGLYFCLVLLAIIPPVATFGLSLLFTPLEWLIYRAMKKSKHAKTVSFAMKGNFAPVRDEI
jgi:hypothetical protein